MPLWVPMIPLSFQSGFTIKEELPQERGDERVGVGGFVYHNSPQYNFTPSLAAILPLFFLIRVQA